MVGLSDIPVVGKAVDMISEAMVNAAYRGLRYVFCYKSIVNDLKSAIEKSNDQEVRVSRKVDEEKDNGKIIEDRVFNWQKEVEGIQQDSEKFLKRYENRASWKCIKCVPIPNPLNRFRIGRDAEKKADKLAGVTQSGKELLDNPIARLPPVENLPKTNSKFQNFQSRKDVYEKLWKSLVTEGGPRILGIYGMPGVGKTRIAEQIWEEAKEKKVFDKVTKAVVSSGKLAEIKLQQDLAGHLNCTFASQDNVDSRASQLKRSIMNGGKVLIILDDVWREIPLNVIGIPFGDDTTSSEGACKILLTSREENVLRGNNCKDPVKIKALSDDEAWDMFKESVGTGDIPDESLARKVCDKCAGLPLVIRAVGKALMTFKSRDMWKDALERLEDCDFKSVPGIDAEVYACLKLSFDNLVEDAKLCLLLCSLYPEDAEIPIDMLINLATGSQLVRGGRIRVRAMVALLKSSSLVLENEDDKDFKLHDIIRDVARSIAVNDHAFVFAKSDSRLLHINGTPKLLCLDVNDNNFYLPDDMGYEGIHTLWIGSSSLRKDMFQVRKVAGMCENLRCLVLRKIEWEVAVEQQYLGKLRTLVLEDCDIRKTDFSFISEKLETLCIWRCELPRPLNIINLKHLRKLQIISRRSDHEVVLVANTISSLSSCLEELHIPEGFIYQNKENQVNNNNSISQQQLMEISKLTRLKSLKMWFRKSASPPHEEEHIQDLKKVFSNLSEFDISFDSRGDVPLSVSGSLTRLIDLSGNQLETDTFRILIERAQFVWLMHINDVDVSSIFNCNTAEEVFADLKVLLIEYSDTMEHVAARISNHHIQPQTSFFKQLTVLAIEKCSAMKYLFCNSVAKCLMQLEVLWVEHCDVMEAIIMNDGSSYIDGQQEDIIIINFPKLKYLKLSSTPQLKSFYMDNKFRSFMSGADYECQLPALEDVIIDNCGFSTLFPFSVISSSLQQLERIKISNCALLEGIVEEDVRRGNIEASSRDKKKKKIIKLFQLKRVTLRNLPNLRSFMSGADYECHMPALKKVRIDNCGFSTLFPFSVISSSLQQLEISNCALFEGIVEEDVRRSNIEASSRDKKIIKLYHLENVTLAGLPNLRSFMSGADYECHMPALEHLRIDNCGFSTLFPFSVISSLQQLEEIEISNCASLEVIVVEDVRRGNIEASSSRDKKKKKKKKIIKVLFQVKKVTLKDLPNLRSFMSGADSECHMPSLKDVTIDNCGFSTLFTCSTNLQQLNWLKVSNCRLLEYIVGDVRDDDDDDDDDISKTDDKIIITLSHLRSIILKNMPNLKSFGRNSSYDFDMPELSWFVLLQCPHVDNFSSLKTSTGRSINVTSDWHEDGVVVENFNDYIKEIRKRDDSNLISDEGAAAAGETDDDS